MAGKYTVLVAGLGDVGFGVTRELAGVPGLRVVGCSRSPEKGRADVNLLDLVAAARGCSADVDYATVDLSDESDIGRVLEEHEPDLVFQCATSLPYWRIRALPDQQKETLVGAGLGWMAPGNLEFPLKVARALEATGLDGRTRHVNASIPDYTNVVLERRGLTPDCGIGNIGGGRVALLRRGAAERLGTDREEVEIHAAFAHETARRIRLHKSTQGLPYYLKVSVRGEDVTDEVDPEGALRDDGWPEIPDVAYPERGYPLAVAASVRVILAMARDANERIHVPGPNGLPGGWPCRVHGDGVDVAAPRSASFDELERVNNAGLRADGIESIEDDGTIVYTEEAANRVREAIGYDASTLAVDELEGRRDELLERLQSSTEVE